MTITVISVPALKQKDRHVRWPCRVLPPGEQSLIGIGLYCTSLLMRNRRTEKIVPLLTEILARGACFSCKHSAGNHHCLGRCRIRYGHYCYNYYNLARVLNLIETGSDYTSL